MTYENALEKIHSLLSFGSRPGLERVQTLLEKLGNPQDRLKFIHVAGTNGKGSVCEMMSYVLQHAGYKTGLFISPYITDFRERIQINNTPVDAQLLADAVEKTFPIVEELRENNIIITEFEYVNALEFYIHAQENCDVVVLETGLGGLLDSTNVIKPPLCAVITTIGLDHTDILGDTINRIADQKCGIFKEGSIAITSAQDEQAMSVIDRKAGEVNIPVIKSESVDLEVISQTIFGSTLKYNGNLIKLRLAGDHQVENAKTAIAAIEALKSKKLLEISDEAIISGLGSAVNPARFEVLSDKPIVVLDGAHNPNGIESLKNAISRFIPNHKIICVTGMLADKDIDSSIALLNGVFDVVYTVPVNNPRSISAEELAEKYRSVCGDVQSFGNVYEAFDNAVNRARAETFAVVICGSLYLAGEIRPHAKSVL